MSGVGLIKFLLKFLSSSLTESLLLFIFSIIFESRSSCFFPISTFACPKVIISLSNKSKKNLSRFSILSVFVTCDLLFPTMLASCS